MKVKHAGLNAFRNTQNLKHKMTLMGAIFLLNKAASIRRLKRDQKYAARPVTKYSSKLG